MRYNTTSYCIKYFAPADVCFCETKKVPLSEYTHEMKECTDLKCYCKEHIPKSDSYKYLSSIDDYLPII